MMEKKMIEKARLGRAEALAAFRLLRSAETEFGRALRKSKRRGIYSRANEPLTFNHTHDIKNIFALLAA